MRLPAGPGRPGAGPQGDGPVTYVWGIPFCPAGVDRDLYSGAILCQLQVYERCLKRAQSRSLHKAAFGPPVLPRPESGLRPRRQPGQPEAQHGEQHGEEPGKCALEAADEDASPGCGGKAEGSDVCTEDAPDDGGGRNSYAEAQGVVVTLTKMLPNEEVRHLTRFIPQNQMQYGLSFRRPDHILYTLYRKDSNISLCWKITSNETTSPCAGRSPPMNQHFPVLVDHL